MPTGGSFWPIYGTNEGAGSGPFASSVSVSSDQLISLQQRPDDSPGLLGRITGTRPLSSSQQLGKDATLGRPKRPALLVVKLKVQGNAQQVEDALREIRRGHGID